MATQRSKDIEQRILYLHSQGWSQRQIADEIGGPSHTTVRMVLIAHQQLPFNSRLQKEILSLHGQGIPQEKIAVAAGVSPYTVRTVLLGTGQIRGLREPVPPAKVKQVFAMRRRGFSLQDIATAVGYSDVWVGDLLARSGRFPGRVPLRKKSRPNKGCKIPGCGGKHCVHGYCKPHWGMISRGTMDENGNRALDRILCRICGKIMKNPTGRFMVMCKDCRPPRTGERPGVSQKKERAARDKKILALYRRGGRVREIATKTGVSRGAVYSTIRTKVHHKKTWNQVRIDAGLCARCGGKRNRYRFSCDGCHEIHAVQKTARNRLKYKQVPRCNAVGCRAKVQAGGFCRNCYEAWQAGKIDTEGKHALRTCQCSCRFIPSQEDQHRCLACAAGVKRKRAITGAHRAKRKL